VEPSPSDWDRWLSLVLAGRDPSEAARELRLTASAFRRENPGKHAAVLDLSREVRAGADRDLVRDKLREVTANTEHPQWGKSTELLAKTAGMLDDRTRLEVSGGMEVTSPDVAAAIERRFWCLTAATRSTAAQSAAASLLMAALQYVDRPGYHALLLRRTFPELEGADGLIAKAHEWLGRFRESGECLWNEQKHRWTFPSGATIQFGHVKDENAMYAYQGQAYQFVGFDELTHFTKRMYEYIAFTRARRRTQDALAGIPGAGTVGVEPGQHRPRLGQGTVHRKAGAGGCVYPREAVGQPGARAGDV
jgi:hypothetical protein